MAHFFAPSTSGGAAPNARFNGWGNLVSTRRFRLAAPASTGDCLPGGRPIAGEEQRDACIDQPGDFGLRRSTDRQGAFERDIAADQADELGGGEVRIRNDKNTVRIRLA